MDQQTRIGCGAGVLVAFASLMYPYLPPLAAFALIGVLTVIALWGLWPLVGSISLGQAVSWRVPLQTAARICFERIEQTPLGEFVERQFRIEHQRIAYLISSFEARHVPIYGRQPPSTTGRPIPREVLKNLRLADGTNNLVRFAGPGNDEYRDCYILRTDLWKHVRYLKHAQKPEEV